MYDFEHLPGLYLVTDFCSAKKEEKIIEAIDEDETPWDTQLSRRVKHYGYQYSYTGSAAGFRKNKAKKCPDVTGELLKIKLKIEEYINSAEIAKPDFNQCIVNEYFRDHGIAGHVDNVAFGPVVVSLSLGEGCNFVFTHTESREEIKMWLPRRSLLIMSGESRYDWKHSVPKLKTMQCNEERFIIDGEYTVVKRGRDWRRVSVTFRSL